jgi:hypothetical protein
VSFCFDGLKTEQDIVHSFYICEKTQNYKIAMVLKSQTEDESAN